MEFLYQPSFKSRSVTRTSSLKVTLLVEALASGNFSASVLEFPTCYVEANSPESAVSQLQKNFLDRLQNIQAIDWDVPTKDVNPAWMKYAGVFKDDVDFQEIMEEIHAASSSDDETEVDPSYYL
jgi:hypothetical protein